MVKKLFALASVTALTGLVSAVGAAGCTTETVVEESPTDAGTDARQRAETAPPSDDDDEIPQCWSDDPIDASGVGYKPPRVKEGACTEEGSVGVIEALFKEAEAKGEQSITYAAIQKAIADVSKDCAECVFAEDGDVWAPIVTKAGGGVAEVVALNDGGCMTMVSDSEDCGKTIVQANACLDAACGECETLVDSQACNSAVIQTACNESVVAANAACGANFGAYLEACFPAGQHPLYMAIRYQCVHGGNLQPQDAGTDSGTDAGNEDEEEDEDGE